MRTSTAYFAGVGTVVAAVAAGLGGGLFISNVVSPHEPRIEMSKLELRMSEKPIPASNASPEGAPSVAATAPTQTQNQPQSEPVTTASTPAQPSEAATTSTPPVTSPPPIAAPVTQATSEKTNSERVKAPEAAFAKARDSDVRREARRFEDRRKADRRQQWVERRRPRQDQELRDVEQQVRAETEQLRAFAPEPVRLEGPRIQLFGND